MSVYILKPQIKRKNGKPPKKNKNFFLEKLKYAVALNSVPFSAIISYRTKGLQR